MKRIRSLPTAHCLLALALLAGCRHETTGPDAGRTGASETEERTVTLAGRTLVLDGFAGDVRVETGDNAVGTRVRFTRHARGATEASARSRLALVTIEEGQDDELYQYVWRSSGPEDGLSVDVVATVPPGSRVVVRTGAGSVAADGPLAELDAETRAGSLVVGRASAPALRLVTASGDVSLIAATIPRGARWTAETQAGSVDLAVSPGASARVEARTAAGSVDVRGLTGARVERSGGAAGGRAVVTLGRGEASVELSTQAGSVTLGPSTDIDGTETGRVDD